MTDDSQLRFLEFSIRESRQELRTSAAFASIGVLSFSFVTTGLLVSWKRPGLIDVVCLAVYLVLSFSHMRRAKKALQDLREAEAREVMDS